FASSCLRGGSGAGFTTKARRREESPSFWLRLCCSVFICDFVDPFQPAKDFWASSTDPCSSVFICGFIIGVLSHEKPSIPRKHRDGPADLDRSQVQIF